jgi:succinoglycan biosynthesis protein ExoA
VNADHAYPTVSVVLAIRNEVKFIAESLSAILRQDYPAELLQIIVADGMSTDGTRSILREVQKGHPSIEVVDNPGLIVAAGLNVALRAATGDVIVRIDGHTIVEPDYVRTCVETLEETGAHNVGGRMTAVADSPFGWAAAAATSSPFGVGGARFHYSSKEEWVDTVYLGAWRREVFDRIGLFDEELVRDQDDELNYRLREAGGRILLSPRVKSRYFARSSPSALFRQYGQYGFWKVRVMQKHPGQMRPRQFAPPALVLALAGLVLAAPFSRLARHGLLAIVAAYVLADGASSAAIALRARPQGAHWLPAIFPLLHFSYGAGFLWGLFHFARRWKEAAAPEKRVVDDQPGSGPDFSRRSREQSV